MRNLWLSVLLVPANASAEGALAVIGVGPQEPCRQFGAVPVSANLLCTATSFTLKQIVVRRERCLELASMRTDLTAGAKTFSLSTGYGIDGNSGRLLVTGPSAQNDPGARTEAYQVDTRTGLSLDVNTATAARDAAAPGAIFRALDGHGLRYVAEAVPVSLTDATGAPLLKTRARCELTLEAR